MNTIVWKSIWKKKVLEGFEKKLCTKCIWQWSTIFLIYIFSIVLIYSKFNIFCDIFWILKKKIGTQSWVLDNAWTNYRLKKNAQWNFGKSKLKFCDEKLNYSSLKLIKTLKAFSKSDFSRVRTRNFVVWTPTLMKSRMIWICWSQFPILPIF